MLISERTPNSNFSVNHEDNENDLKNEIIQTTKMKVAYPANKYMFKVAIEKMFWCLYG